MRKPNWWAPLMRAAKAHGLPASQALAIADIRHDDWCARLSGKGTCDCNPDVTLISKTAEETT